MLRDNGNCEICGVPIDAAGTVANRRHYLFHQHINELEWRCRGLENGADTKPEPCHDFNYTLADFGLPATVTTLTLACKTCGQRKVLHA